MNTTETTSTEPCGWGKLKAPYKCHMVPTEEIVKFLDKYPKLCRFVFWDLHVGWLTDVERTKPWMRLQMNKRYWLHPLMKYFEAIAQRKFNYSKATVSGGHIRSRFGNIYRQKHKLGWRFADKKIYFYENGVLIKTADRL